MKKPTAYSRGFGIAAILIAVIAVVAALVACGGDSASSAEVSALDTRIAAQSAEIQSLSEQVGSLQSELAAATAASAAAPDETAALRSAIDEMKMELDDQEPAEDYSDDIHAIEDGIAELEDAVSENADNIDAIPDAMGAIASALIAEHADEHDGLEAAIRMAFDEHGAAHGQLEDAIEEAVGELLEEGENEGNEIAELLARLERLEQASAPVATQAYVDDAIRYYNRNGLQATLAHYNTLDSVDGDLYLFVLDADYKLIVHPTVPTNIGMDIRGPLGTDITGKNYGAEALTVDENGKWVDYVYLNPADNFDYERKHSWIVRHDNLIFGSGWYERDVALESAPATYTRALVEQAVARYDANGRDATVNYYNSPESVDGQHYVFIGDENDVMLAHATVPANVGKHFNDIISPDGYPAGAQVAAAAVEGGAWTTYTYLNTATDNVETKHSWVTRHNGMIFGSGWYEEGPSKSDSAAYAQSLVQRATHLYADLGREAAIAYYNSPQSLDGEWYTFVLEASDLRSLANAARPELVGIIPERIDATGYNYGAEFSTVTEDGKWVSYMFKNPAMNDELAQKHTWLVKRDDLLFGAGYYEE